jgi:hypothetical protein
MESVIDTVIEVSIEKSNLDNSEALQPHAYATRVTTSDHLVAYLSSRPDPTQSRVSVQNALMTA